MSVLTDREIAVCIASVGWGPGPGNTANAIKFLDTAIAVCRAESGGDTTTVSATHDFGLWQINLKTHPEIAGLNIFDVFVNTVEAKKIYDAAGGWTPWSSYNSGTYRAHLGHGSAAYKWLQNATQEQINTVKASAKSKSGDSTNAMNAAVHSVISDALPGHNWTDNIANGAQNGVDNVGHAIGKVVNSIPDAIMAVWGNIYQGMKTVGVFLIAIVLGILGLVFLMKDTAVGKGVTGNVKTAAKIAAVA